MSVETTIAFQIITWNLRSLASYTDASFFEKELSENPQAIYCLQETGLRGKFLDSICHQFKSKYAMVFSTATHRCNGVAVFVPHGRADIVEHVELVQGYGIALRVRMDGVLFSLVNIYMPQLDQAALTLLERLDGWLVRDLRSSGVVVGDFNCTLDPSLDRNSPTEYRGRVSGELRRLVTKFSFTDLWRSTNGQRRVPTWRSGERWARLDRAYVSADLLTYCRYSQIYERVVRGDHFPFEFGMCFKTPKHVSDGPGRLPEYFLREPEMATQIEHLLGGFGPQPGGEGVGDAWAFLKSSLVDKICSFHTLSMSLNPKDTRAAVERIKANQKIAQLPVGPSMLGWEQTRHLARVKKGRSALVQLVAADGSVLTGEDMTREVRDFYTALFSAKAMSRESQGLFLDGLPQVDDPGDALGAPITVEEIRKAIQTASENSSPGKDGLGYGFYKAFEPLIVPILYEVYEEIFRTRSCPYGFQDALIRLIPKKPDPLSVDDWRPISLLNCDYKILTKILAGRLQGVLGDIVGPHQTCSIRGRSIGTNIKCVRDLLQTQGRMDGLIYSVDQKKAFDNVSHGYLFSVLESFGFSDGFRAWIETLVSGGTCEVRSGTVVTDSIDVDAGIRQGDSLSPLLYILAIEPLLVKVNRDLVDCGIERRYGRQLVCLAYADDIVLFLRDPGSIDRFLRIYHLFSELSGARINVNKSAIIPLTQNTRYECLRLRLGVSEGAKFFGIYFGGRGWEPKNWTGLVGALDGFCGEWDAYKHQLTIFERARLINSIFVPKVRYILEYIDPPENWLVRIMGRIRTWVNNNKRWPRRTLFHQTRALGGLGIDELVSWKKSQQIVEAFRSLVSGPGDLYYSGALRLASNTGDEGGWLNPYFNKIKRMDEVALPKAVRLGRNVLFRHKQFKIKIRARETLTRIRVSDYTVCPPRALKALGRLGVTTFGDLSRVLEGGRPADPVWGLIRDIVREWELSGPRVPEAGVQLYDGEGVIAVNFYKLGDSRRAIQTSLLGKQEGVRPCYPAEGSAFTMAFAEKAWRLRKGCGVTPRFLHRILQRPNACCPICEAEEASESHYLGDCQVIRQFRPFIKALLQGYRCEISVGQALREGVPKGKQKNHAVVSDVLVVLLATVQDQIYAKYNRTTWDGSRLLCKRIYSLRNSEKVFFAQRGQDHLFRSRWSGATGALRALYGRVPEV